MGRRLIVTTCSALSLALVPVFAISGLATASPVTTIEITPASDALNPALQNDEPVRIVVPSGDLAPSHYENIVECTDPSGSTDTGYLSTLTEDDCDDITEVVVNSNSTGGMTTPPADLADAARSYTLYALPNDTDLVDSGSPITCDLTHECILYIGPTAHNPIPAPGVVYSKPFFVDGTTIVSCVPKALLTTCKSGTTGQVDYEDGFELPASYAPSSSTTPPATTSSTSTTSTTSTTIPSTSTTTAASSTTVAPTTSTSTTSTTTARSSTTSSTAPAVTITTAAPATTVEPATSSTTSTTAPAVTTTGPSTSTTNGATSTTAAPPGGGGTTPTTSPRRLAFTGLDAWPIALVSLIVIVGAELARRAVLGAARRRSHRS